MSREYTIELSSLIPKHSDKCILPASLLSEAIASHDPLPHPMVYSLNGEILIGVKEFTAPENTILVSENVYERLNSKSASCDLRSSLPKATSLRIRPTQFYAHVTNWKYYLESFLSTLYTTLSIDQRLFYHDMVAGVDVELIVDAANANSVIVVDTDIALDVAPLNDIMAAQQMKQESEMLKYEQIPEIASNSSLVAEIEPFNSPTRPTIYKINLLKYPQRFGIQLTIPEDFYNADLICSLDKLVTLENFMWSTMAQDSQTNGRKVVYIDTTEDLFTNTRLKHPDSEELWLYMIPFAWEHRTSIEIDVGERITGITESSPPQEEIPEGKSKCSNCRLYIDESKLTLHEAFCSRNNVRCSCGEVFPKEIPATHWHCDICSDVHGESALYKFKHDKLNHSQPYVCDRCSDETQYESFLELVQKHKAGDCSSRLHECRFCHLVVPQGEATFEDNFLNLTHHENECGNKTVECYQCGKVLRNKELASHLKIHDLVKTAKNAEVFPKCSNQNCINSLSADGNPLLLCETCYGPLYLSVNDPTNSKLQSRIERKYVLQLTRGCGNSWCENIECADGNAKLALKDALSRVKSSLLPNITSPLLPSNAGKTLSPQNTFWFCVSETMQKKKNFADQLLSQAQYQDNMIYKAIAAQGTDGAHNWLIENAA